MIIFKDLLTGDEMFTDSSKYKVVDDCLYEVECRHISRKHGDVLLDGANPSQEEADEGTDDVVESGLDLVLNQRLIETGFSKNDFKVYLKGYTKTLQDKWKEMGKSDAEISLAKTKFTEAVKKVLPKLGDLQFFMGSKSKMFENMERIPVLNRLSMAPFAQFSFTCCFCGICSHLGGSEGESSNPDGLIAFLEYRVIDGGDEKPIMIFFKHGLEEEKV